MMIIMRFSPIVFISFFLFSCRLKTQDIYSRQLGIKTHHGIAKSLFSLDIPIIAKSVVSLLQLAS